MRGWEIGGHHGLQEEQDDLVSLDPKNAHEDRLDNRQECDDDWRSWHLDEPQPDVDDEWDEMLLRVRKQHRHLFSLASQTAASEVKRRMLASPRLGRWTL